MKTFIQRFLLLALFLLAVLVVVTQTRSRTPVVEHPVIALRCGRLLDVRTGHLVPRAIILVGDRRIMAVGARLSIPRGARVIDLSGATVLPGLIDAHTHITYHFDSSGHFGSTMEETPGTTLRYAAENARNTLYAGFTTIRNLGAGGLVDLRLRDAIAHGEKLGPRMVVSGQPLLPDEIPGTASSPEEAGEKERLSAIREFVRARIHEGVDVIKIFEGVDADGKPLLSEDEIRAAVKEASAARRRVAVHAHEAASIKAAVRGGCTSIEHGTFLDGEGIGFMLEHHTALVPTLYLPTYYLEHKSQFSFDNSTWEFFERLRSRNLESARRAHKAGVRIIAGSDAVAGVHGHNARELEWLVKAGLTPAEAIRAATVDAAELLGIQDQVGEIKAGKMADVIAVEGDPLRDITLLQQVRFVMREGRVIRSSGSIK